MANKTRESLQPTHLATVVGGFGRSRVRLRDGGKRWWVSASGVRFNKDTGVCRTENSRLLVGTIQKIAHPTGVFHEFEVQGYNRPSKGVWD